MTVGEVLRRRHRIVMTVAASGGGLFVAAIVGTQLLRLPDWLWGIGLAGFGVAWLMMMGTYLTGLGFRCPACRANLVLLFQQRPGWGDRDKVRFCPYCGCDLDATEWTSGESDGAAAG
ncbi:MAG TPA: hypothetical protein VF170_02935 [Planctomycetaceae bacterium]